MVKITKEAAFIPSKSMFSTGEIKYSRNRTIYGLVQCTRDIPEGFCDNCLESALGDLKACCKSREGGIVVSRNCNMRYQMYRFYSTYPTSKGQTFQSLINSCLSVNCILTKKKSHNTFLCAVKN
jgi:hypothetical protein